MSPIRFTARGLLVTDSALCASQQGQTYNRGVGAIPDAPLVARRQLRPGRTMRCGIVVLPASRLTSRLVRTLLSPADPPLCRLHWVLSPLWCVPGQVEFYPHPPPTATRGANHRCVVTDTPVHRPLTDNQVVFFGIEGKLGRTRLLKINTLVGLYGGTKQTLPQGNGLLSWCLQ